MAIHSSILVWEIPWTEEPGGLIYKHTHYVYFLLYLPVRNKFYKEKEKHLMHPLLRSLTAYLWNQVEPKPSFNKLQS